MSKRIGLYLFAITMMLFSLLLAQHVNAEEPNSYRWSINANSHKGKLQYTVHGNRITGTIYSNEKIEGYQVGRQMVFYRERSKQIWIGLISDNKSIIGGTFSHWGKNSYPWYGTKTQ